MFKRPSFSLFIAIAIIGALSVIALTLSNLIIGSLTRVNEIQDSEQAYFAGKSGIELAKLALRSQGPGYTVGLSNFKLSNGTDVSYSINGQTSKFPNMTYYTVPPVNKGDAMDNCSNSNSTDPLDECNWYKLYPGGTVAIPLYTQATNSDGTVTTKNPVDLGLTGIEIYFRAPCADLKNISTTCTRSKLHADFDRQVVVNWLINGNCSGTSLVGNCSAGAFSDATETNDSRIKGVDINGYTSKGFYLSEILKVNLNNLTSPNLKSFLTNTAYKLSEPVLKFTEINSIYNTANQNIPYLEYQIKYFSNDSNASFPDRFERIYSEGINKNFTSIQTENIELDSGSSTFTISL